MPDKKFLNILSRVVCDKCFDEYTREGLSHIPSIVKATMSCTGSYDDYDDEFIHECLRHPEVKVIQLLVKMVS